MESECPERERFPQEWKSKSSLQKLLILRAVRPDRMTYALRSGQVFIFHPKAATSSFNKHLTYKQCMYCVVSTAAQD